MVDRHISFNKKNDQCIKHIASHKLNKQSCLTTGLSNLWPGLLIGPDPSRPMADWTHFWAGLGPEGLSKSVQNFLLGLRAPNTNNLKNHEDSLRSAKDQIKILWFWQDQPNGRKRHLYRFNLKSKMKFYHIHQGWQSIFSVFGFGRFGFLCFGISVLLRCSEIKTSFRSQLFANIANSRILYLTF